MYIDIHCHLDMLEKEGADLDKVIERVRKKRVGIIVANSINSVSNRKTLGFLEKYKEVRAAMGIYPINALKMSDDELDKEVKFIKKNKKIVIAIGEVGMDYKLDLKNWEKQEKNFEKFIKLSKALDVPIIVHSRKAEKECIELLEKLKARKVIMHSFGGKKGLVERIIRNNWYFSIPTSVKNSEHFQKIVQKAEVEKLFCETDSPYLHPDKEFPNEPANVIESYRMIAKIKKIGLQNVERKLERNFKELFGI